MTKEDRLRAKFAEKKAEVAKIHSERTIVAMEQATTRSPGELLAEERRLAAVHDPSKPSGCRGCGVTVVEDWSEVASWKVCPRCQPLIAGGLDVLLSEVLGVDVTADEAFEVCALIGNPAFFVGRWPTDPGSAEPWEHFGVEAVASGREAVDEIRSRLVPRRNSFRTGCCWCGVRTSTRWTQTSFRAGRGPDASRFAACSSCEPWVTRSGVGGEHFDDWRPHLLACCTGMRKAQAELTFDLKAYFESNPAEVAGTGEPWAYLGSVRGQLRMRVARLHPRLITLTEREQRVLALQEAMADVGRPAAPTQLANLAGTAAGVEVTTLPGGGRPLQR